MKTVSLNLRIAKNAEQHNQSIREPRIASFLLDSNANTVGVQEASDFWRDRLDATLTGYRRVQPNMPTPETFKNYIFYNESTTRLIEGGQFWLSETPNEASKAFGSRFFISAGWGIFEDIGSGIRFAHVNTHLDAFSEETRKCELPVLLAHSKPLAEKYPLIITGDFNSREESIIYETAVSCGFLRDFKVGLPAPSVSHTFQGYESEDREPEKRILIDFGFCNSLITPKSYDVVDKYAGGYMSDHNALIFEF